MLDGEMWRISPDEQTFSSGLYRARRSADLDQAIEAYNRKKRGAYPSPLEAVQADMNGNISLLYT